MNKKYIIILLILTIIVTGCQLGNTPISKVEEQLSKYQMLDNSIEIDYHYLTNSFNIDNEYITSYEDLIKKQYKNLSYEIKEEVIDGEKATVTTRIEVKDYQKTIDKYKDSLSNENYHEKILTELEKTNDKITYTIDFSLKKDKEGNWKVLSLSKEDKLKLLGINYK